MKLPVASIRRILTALFAIATTAAATWAGWAAWQDHAYANEVARANHRVAAVNEREFGAAALATPTYLCEKRNGMPVAEALVRVIHASDAASLTAARRSASSFDQVKAPSRWSEFNDLLRIRRRLDVDLATSTDAANARAVEVAATARPRTNLGVIEALIHDRSYRLLAAEADGTTSAIRTVNSKMRHALPAHHLHAKAIEGELDQTNQDATLRLGELYMSITRPRPGSPAPADSPTHRATTAAPGLPSDPAGPKC